MKVTFAVVKQLKQPQRKSRKNSEASMGFEPMTSAPDTGAILYQLRYQASLEAGQVRVQFIPVI